MTIRQIGQPKNKPSSASGTLEPDTELAARIAKLVEMVGGQGRAASIASVSRATIQAWRTGNSRPPLIELAVLARAAGVSVDWIATGVRSTDDSVVLLPRMEVINGEVVPPTELKPWEAPLIPWWKYLLTEEGANIDATAAFYVSGREMEPTVPEFGIIAVDRYNSGILSAGIYALVLNNRLAVARLEPRFDGSLILRQDAKPNEAQMVPEDKVPGLRIIGRVLGAQIPRFR